MGTDRPAAAAAGCHHRRWDSGALAHAVTDPFGQGPLPWLRGSEQYLDDSGQLLPWYVDPTVIEPSVVDRIGAMAGDRVPAPRSARHRNPGPRNADDVHLQIKGFVSPG